MKSTSSTPLRDNRLRMRFAQLAQWARAGLAVLMVLVYWLEYRLLQQGAQGLGITEAEAETNNWLVKGVGGVQMVITLMALIALVQWAYRAYQNVHRLSPTPPAFSTSTAVWSWFIPIVNFIIPFKILHEIGHVLGGFSASSDKRLSSRWDYLLAGWVALQMGVTIMSRLSVRIALDQDVSLAESADNDKLLMLGQLVTLASALVTLALLKTIAPREQLALDAQQVPQQAPHQVA